jgi:hypothetical protein
VRHERDRRARGDERTARNDHEAEAASVGIGDRDQAPPPRDD